MIPGAVALWKAIPVPQRRMILSLVVAIGLANIAQPYPDLAPPYAGRTLDIFLCAL
jgi:putative membrane protein